MVAVGKRDVQLTWHVPGVNDLLPLMPDGTTPAALRANLIQTYYMRLVQHTPFTMYNWTYSVPYLSCESLSPSCIQAGLDYSTPDAPPNQMNGLTPNKQYTAYITANNDPVGGLTSSFDTGSSPESEGYTFTTSESEPARYVFSTNDVTEYNDSLKIQLYTSGATWARCQSYGLPVTNYTIQIQSLGHHGIANGPVNAYTFEYKPGVSNRIFVGAPSETPSDATANMALTLDPAEDYRVQIACWNRQGSGDFSSWRNVHTVHRPNQVKNVTLNDAGPTFLQIGWKPCGYDKGTCEKAELSRLLEACCNHGEPITRYEIEVTSGEFNQTFFETDVDLVLSSIPYDTAFSFRVRAENSYGVGAWSERFDATTLGYMPTIDGMRVGPQGNVTIAWDFYEAVGNGYPVDMYQMRVCQCPSGAGDGSVATGLPADGCWPGSHVSTEYSHEGDFGSGYGSRLRYVASGLSPDTPYVLRVRANSTGYPDFTSCLNNAACPWYTSRCRFTGTRPPKPNAPVEGSYPAFANKISYVSVKWVAPSQVFPATYFYLYQDGIPITFPASTTSYLQQVLPATTYNSPSPSRTTTASPICPTLSSSRQGRPSRRSRRRSRGRRRTRTARPA